MSGTKTLEDLFPKGNGNGNRPEPMKHCRALSAYLKVNQRTIDEIDRAYEGFVQGQRRLQETITEQRLARSFADTINSVKIMLEGREGIRTHAFSISEREGTFLPEDTRQKLDDMINCRNIWINAPLLDKVQVLEDVTVLDGARKVIEQYDRIYFVEFRMEDYNHTHAHPLEKAMRILRDNEMFLPSVHLTARLKLHPCTNYLTATRVRHYKAGDGVGESEMHSYYASVSNIPINTEHAPKPIKTVFQSNVNAWRGGALVYADYSHIIGIPRPGTTDISHALAYNHQGQAMLCSEGVDFERKVYVKKTADIKFDRFFGATTDYKVIARKLFGMLVD